MKFIAVLLACVLAAEGKQNGTFIGGSKDQDTFSPSTARPTSVSITPSFSTTKQGQKYGTFIGGSKDQDTGSPSTARPTSVYITPSVSTAKQGQKYGTFNGGSKDQDTFSPSTARPTSVSITPSISTTKQGQKYGTFNGGSKDQDTGSPSIARPTSVSITPSVSTAKPVVVPTFPVTIEVSSNPPRPTISSVPPRPTVSSVPPRPTAVYPSQVTSVPRVHSDDGSAKTLRYENEVTNNDGRNYFFETTNGIIAQAQLLNYGQPPKTSISGEGYFSWTSPEGKFVEVHYTADQNGYQPTSDVIPKVSPQMARALEYAAKYAARIKN